MKTKKMESELKIALAQITPIWLNKAQTSEKICTYLSDAAKQKADLVVFGEALLPGYPFWLSFTNGAKFNSSFQKEIHAHYIRNAVQIENGDLDNMCTIAAENKMAFYLGTIERAQNRGGHSLYCSLVYIDPQGEIKSVHRKLMPTYEERLSWSIGDGNGLKVHPLKEFTVGGLNCWENWMPLARASLYGQGENLHVAVWPGSEGNAEDITRFIAMEARSYVVSVSGMLSKKDIPKNIPHADEIIAKAPEVMANGGSCIAGPDGKWIIKPIVGEEKLEFATIDFSRVLEERQNFDVSGNYSRPDVTKLIVNKKRQKILEFTNSSFEVNQ